MTFGLIALATSPLTKSLPGVSLGASPAGDEVRARALRMAWMPSQTR
jgi:hypothetical protein